MCTDQVLVIPCLPRCVYHIHEVKGSSNRRGTGWVSVHINLIVSIYQGLLQGSYFLSIVVKFMLSSLW